MTAAHERTLVTKEDLKKGVMKLTDEQAAEVLKELKQLMKEQEEITAQEP